MSDPTDPNALLGLAEDLVAKAMRRGADQAEAYWGRDVALTLDLENNMIAGSGRARSEGAGLRVVKDGRVGFAYLTSTKQIDETIEQALRLSRLAPKKDLELPGGSVLPRLGDRWDDGIAALEVGQALEMAKTLLATREAEGTDVQLAGGGVELAWDVEAIANSEGVAACDQSTGISLGVNLILQEGDSALNMWDSDSAHIGRPDPEALFHRVATDLRSLAGSAPGREGEVDVAFRPDAVTELMSGLVVAAVTGEDAMRGKTVWSDALGTDVADERLEILDDPLREGALGVGPFDGDGLPSQRLPIIAGGVLKHFLFDIRDGQEHGQPSTHSAVRGSFKSLPGVGVHHLVVEGSHPQPDDKLIRGMDEGYLVESVLGAHTANATTGDFSITAPNVWRVEKGEVVGAADGIAIGGNLPDLLKRLDGVGDAPKRMDGALVPMLRFRDVQVSV